MKQFPCAFPYNKNYVDALEVTLSPGRLHLYRKYAGNDDVEALKLYCWNTCLSQVFYWPLHAFEVSLRNAMADRMYDEYGDDWYERIDSFKRGRGNNEEVEHVDKAKRKLDQDGLAYGHDNIVAAISMGFWEGLLKVEYEEKLWKQLFSAIFPIDRSEAFRKVNQIKRLRNNVAHHEPVFVFLPKGDKRLLYKDYKLVLKLIRWICEDTADWIEYHGSGQFFTIWNGAPPCIGAPPLTVRNAGDENNSRLWQFTN
jgi:hypothetical protein